jgi:cobalt-zinc-cadmium resistance protein CzcA
MIRALVDFALNNRFVVVSISLLLVLWGAISFHTLPVEAYPDIGDNYVTVITQWPGRSAEEVEQLVTIPIEIQMAGMPHMTFLRSESIFGLSFVIMIFDDSSVNDWNRQKVLERLTQVNLPPGQGLSPQIGTDWSTVGQIYWYTLRSTNPKYDLTELRSIEDWTLLKQFKSVPNVVDVSDFGGTVREYQVKVDPNKLVEYGLSIGQVEQQLANNNINAGGSFVEVGQQQMNVRALGLLSSVQDIGQTLLKTQAGTAIRVRDIADVNQGPKIRLGHMARANHIEDGRIVDEPDVIQGGVLLRKGAEEEATLIGIHEYRQPSAVRTVARGTPSDGMTPRAFSHFQNANPIDACRVRGSTKCVPLNVDRKLYSAIWLVRFATVNESRMRRRPSACSRLSVPIPALNRLRGFTRSGL